MTLPRRTLLCAAIVPLAAPRAGGAEPASLLLQCPLSAPPAVLIPGVSSSLGTRLVGSNLYRGLCRIAADGTPVPDMAAWEASADGLRYLFRLDPGLTWHDSGAVTAADVVFSIGRFHPALSPAPWQTQMARIAAPDAQTVAITLRQPVHDLPRQLTVLDAPIVPEHVHAVPGWGLDPRRTMPVGSGPFSYDGWLRLTRFEWFVGPRPAFSELAFPMLPDPGAPRALLQSGQPAVLVAETVDAAELAKLRADPALNVEGVYPQAAGRSAWLLVNGVAAPLDNPEVRGALVAAIDREAVLWAIWNGLGRVAAGGPAYNPRAAAAALQAAGLRPDGNGIRAHLRLLVQPDAALQHLAAVIVRMLSLIAVAAAPETAEELDWHRRVGAGDYDLAVRVGRSDEPRAAPPLVLADLATLVARDRRLQLPTNPFGGFAAARFA